MSEKPIGGVETETTAKVVFRDRSGRIPDYLTRADKEQMVTLLKLARDAKNDPVTSGYHVRAVIADDTGRWGRGGNIELPRRTRTHNHGETAALSDFTQRHGADFKIRYLGFYTDGESTVSPCGDCRDALKPHTDMEKGLGFSGPLEGTVNVARLGDFYFENFEKADKCDDSECLAAADESLSRIHNPYANNQTTLYGAAIRMKSGIIYSPRGLTNAGYHEVKALPAALTAIRPGTLEEVAPEHIILAVKGSEPGIDYDSRQYLEEYRAGLAAHTGDHNLRFPIFIEWQDKNGVKKLFQTNTEEWLPLPFTAADFGMNEQLRANFAKAFLKK